MAPLRGWSVCGKRLIGKAPHGHWRTQTFLAALRCDRIEAPCVFDGPINGVKFLTYVQEFLLPSLKAGDGGAISGRRYRSTAETSGPEDGV